MDIFQKEIQEICQAFNIHSVRYLLIGGFAVNYHGYPRSTGDLDLWIDDKDDNKKKLIDALETLNYDISEFKSVDLKGAPPIDIPLQNFKIELIPFLSTSLSFDDAFNAAIEGNMNGIPIKVIHLNHLIQSKSNSNRLRDTLDVEELKKRNNL